MSGLRHYTLIQSIGSTLSRSSDSPSHEDLPGQVNTQEDPINLCGEWRIIDNVRNEN